MEVYSLLCSSVHVCMSKTSHTCFTDMETIWRHGVSGICGKCEMFLCSTNILSIPPAADTPVTATSSSSVPQSHVFISASVCGISSTCWSVCVVRHRNTTAYYIIILLKGAGVFFCMVTVTVVGFCVIVEIQH